MQVVHLQISFNENNKLLCGNLLPPIDEILRFIAS